MTGQHVQPRKKMDPRKALQTTLRLSGADESMSMEEKVQDKGPQTQPRAAFSEAQTEEAKDSKQQTTSPKATTASPTKAGSDEEEQDSHDQRYFLPAIRRSRPTIDSSPQQSVLSAAAISANDGVFLTQSAPVQLPVLQHQRLASRQGPKPRERQSRPTTTTTGSARQRAIAYSKSIGSATSASLPLAETVSERALSRGQSQGTARPTTTTQTQRPGRTGSIPTLFTPVAPIPLNPIRPTTQGPVQSTGPIDDGQGRRRQTAPVYLHYAPALADPGDPYTSSPRFFASSTAGPTGISPIKSKRSLQLRHLKLDSSSPLSPLAKPPPTAAAPQPQSPPTATTTTTTAAGGKSATGKRPTRPQTTVTGERDASNAPLPRHVVSEMMRLFS